MKIIRSIAQPFVYNQNQAELIYYPDFLTFDFADFLFEELKNKLSWQQDQIKVFGKTYNQPRLTALQAENKLSYSYSNITMQPKEFSTSVKNLKQQIEKKSQHYFTTCLFNFYRDGSDSNGWHADDEPELGTNPCIASISLGATRKFKLRNKSDSSIKLDFELKHGSLLIMKGETQHYWQHQIPKTKRKVGERINLTFRKIVNDEN
ncbi:MAG: alpha-ketoglutarate-dependent dioxygenase AlkB family protein [Bacteroidota bacterium]